MVEIADSKMHPLKLKNQPELLASIIDVLAEEKIVSGKVYFLLF